MLDQIYIHVLLIQHVVQIYIQIMVHVLLFVLVQVLSQQLKVLQLPQHVLHVEQDVKLVSVKLNQKIVHNVCQAIILLLQLIQLVLLAVVSQIVQIVLVQPLVMHAQLVIKNLLIIQKIHVCHA